MIIPMFRIISIEEIKHDTEMYRQANGRCWIAVEGMDSQLTVIDEFEKLRELLATDPV